MLEYSKVTLVNALPHFDSKPWIPESNFSGVVDALGSNVTHLTHNDPCFGGFPPSFYGNQKGVLAEYVVLPADFVVRKPENITLEEAGGICSNACTVGGFMRVTELREGDRVLVTAASGALGTLTIQAAKAIVGKEGRVVATCSAANEQLVRDLGADEVIDYRLHPELHKHLIDAYSSDPFDVIIDIAGTDMMLYSQCPRYLKPQGYFLFAGKIDRTHGGGGLVTGLLPALAWAIQVLLWSILPLFLGGVPRKASLHRGQVNRDTIRQAASMIEEGKFKGVIDSVWEMEDVLQAYERISTKRARGKVIVCIQD